MPWKTMFARNENDLAPPNDPKAIELVSMMLKYNPKERCNLYEALAHPYFDELRVEYLLLPNGNCIPDLFNFSEKEIKDMPTDDIRDIL